jgi:hypothetical protein
VDAEIRKREATRIRAFAERYTAAWCSRDPVAVAAFFSTDGSLTIRSPKKQLVGYVEYVNVVLLHPGQANES